MLLTILYSPLTLAQNVSINKSITPILEGYDIRGIAYDNQGRCWLASKDGLLLYDGHNIYKPIRELAYTNILNILKDPRKNRIWVFTIKGFGYLDFDNFSFRTIRNIPIKEPSWAGTIKIDSSDNVNVLYPDHLFCKYNIEGKETLRINLNTLVGNGEVKGFCLSRDSIFFAKRSFAPTIVAYNTITRQKRIHIIKHTDIHWLENIENTENSLLIMDKKLGFLLIDNRYKVQKASLFERLNKENNYNAYWLQQISNGKWALIYKNGNIYELTRNGISRLLINNFSPMPYYSRDVMRNYNNEFIVFNQKGIYAINNISPTIKRLFYNLKPKLSTRNICKNDNGSLYIGSYSGLVEYNPNQKNWKIYNKDLNPLTSPTVKDVSTTVPFALYSKADYIYIGSEGYPFYRFNTKSKNFEYNFYEHPDFAKNNFFGVYVIYPINNTFHLLLGYNRGLAMFDLNSNKLSILQTSKWIGEYNEVYAINFYEKNKYLIGTKLGLYLLDLKDTTMKIIPSVKDYTVNSIYIDKQLSEIWVGTTERGIIILHNNLLQKKIIDSKSGIPSEQVVSISNGPKNDKWIATGNGISYYNGKSFINYSKEDGVTDNESNRFSSLIDNGHLYIGSINGVSCIDLDHIQHPSQDKIFISQISLWRSSSGAMQLFSPTTLPKNNLLEIFPNDRGLRFSFGTSDIRNNGKSSFMYRIKEVSNEWEYIGEFRNLRFEGLPYGTLHLEVRSNNRNNIQSKNTIYYTIIVKKPFYLNWYFYVGISILFLGIVYTFMQQKNLAIKKLAEQRVDIARTLHDDLGVIITAIRFNIETELSLKKIESSSFLNKIYGLSQKASLSIYESLWIIDSQKDTWDSLFDKFEEVNDMLLSPMKAIINIDFNADDNQSKISPLLRQQLFFIYKEAINNLVKHAIPDHIYITAKIKANHFELEFKNDKIKNDRIWSYEMGLQNIVYRASTIKSIVETDINEGWFILKIRSI